MEKGDFCIFFETGSMKGRFLMILLVAGLGARGQAKNDIASLAATANLSRSQWDAVEGLFQLVGKLEN
jgi:hypothetical protein